MLQPHEVQLLQTHPCSFCPLYAELDLACGGNGEDPDTPLQSDSEDREEEQVAPLASACEDLGSDMEASAGRIQHSPLRYKAKNG